MPWFPRADTPFPPQRPHSAPQGWWSCSCSCHVESHSGRLAVAAVVVVDLLVGFALIYLGAHWFTDVVAGAALGGIIGVVTFMTRNRIRNYRRASKALT